MNEPHILLEDVLSHNQDYDPALIEKLYQAALSEQHRKIVVFDDDPTGIQTTHSVYVYTRWDVDTIVEALSDSHRMFYILTNSRSMTSKETERLHVEITENLVKAAEITGKNFVIMLRGDSTLRGHFPLETETIRRVLNGHGIPVDGEILIPFFPEGGRYTAGDVHYLTQDQKTLIPVGESEFARDWTFSYHASNLKEWVEEKSGGRFPKESVESISLEELSELKFPEIQAKILGLREFGKMIVNCTSYLDLKVFMTAFMRALESGKNYIFRCASSSTKVLGGVPDRPLLSKEELTGVNDFGLIVIGSHTQKTTAQFLQLRESYPELCYIEFDITHVMKPGLFETEQQRVQALLDASLAQEVTTVLYTTREDFTVNSGDKEDELRAAAKISDAVTGFVKKLQVQPGFIIAKGGITSSGIGTQALGVRRAYALGQILPGVPVWKLGTECRFEGTSFIIFPGNVGTEAALKNAADILLS